MTHSAAPERELVVEFAEWWANGCRGRSRFALRDGLLWPLALRPNAGAPDISIPGTLFASLTDHHVHLGLVDIDELWRGGLTRVHDLGWRPTDAARWFTSNTAPVVTLRPGAGLSPATRVQTPREIEVVGGLLSCRDGYPSHSAWAPSGATIELNGPEDAAAAVRQQVELGASAIKVTLNSDAGPVPSDELLAAIVSEARGGSGGEWYLDVIAHAQGVGQVERAFNAGIGALAHAPFSERISDELIVAMATGAGPHPTATTWISTLDKHGWGEHTPEFEIALDNVRRFHAAGGRVLYGTDLGDGPLPQGVNERELLALVEAGFDREALLRSIAASWLHDLPRGLDTPSSQARAALDQRVARPAADQQRPPVGPRFAWVPGLPPTGAAATASWLTTARSTTATQLEESLR